MKKNFMSFVRGYVKTYLDASFNVIVDDILQGENKEYVFSWLEEEKFDDAKCTVNEVVAETLASMDADQSVVYTEVYINTEDLLWEGETCHPYFVGSKDSYIF